MPEPGKRNGALIGYIYVLIDPTDRRIRYVGQTYNLSQRRSAHCSGNGEAPKDSWVRSILKIGLRPVFEVIEEVPIQNLDDREIYWIKRHLDNGASLLNVSPGGQRTEANRIDRWLKDWAEEIESDINKPGYFSDVFKLPINEQIIAILSAAREFRSEICLLKQARYKAEYSQMNQQELLGEYLRLLREKSQRLKTKEAPVNLDKLLSDLAVLKVRQNGSKGRA